jgi:hypothetical protein
MSRSRIFKAPVAALLLLVLLAAACSSSGGSKADGDKTAFCKTNSDINAELNKATSPQDVITTFKKFEKDFDAYLKNAPAEVKSEAQTQVDFARKIIKDNDPTELQTEDKSVTAAGKKVDSFCGVSSSSSDTDNGSDDTVSSDADSDSSATDAKGNAAVCSAFQDIQDFSQVSAEVATKSWPEIQALFKQQQDKIAEAYSNVEKSAPDTVAADVRLVAAFTDKLIAAALVTDSPEAWAQQVGADPDAAKAGEAATRMATFAETECGINPSSASS